MTLPYAQQLRREILQANIPDLTVDDPKYDPTAGDYYLVVKSGNFECPINSKTEWEAFREAWVRTA